MLRPLADVGDPRFLQLLIWWRAARGDRAWPARADFEPLQFPRLLPNIFLCDVTDGAPPRFVYRLTGTAIDRALGANGAGRPITDLPIFSNAQSEWRQFARTVELGEPTYLDHGFLDEKGQLVHYRRLLLPLGRSDARVDTLLGCLIFVHARQPVGFGLGP
jgi:hypothetical protein